MVNAASTRVMATPRRGAVSQSAAWVPAIPTAVPKRIDVVWRFPRLFGEYMAAG